METIYHYLDDYLDVGYLRYLFWVLSPIIVLWLIPFIIVIFLIGCAFWVHIYKYWNRIQEAIANKDIWAGALRGICAFWYAQGRIWHGYEVRNYEHIPATGGALIIYYHGTLPIDCYYLVSKILLERGRQVQCIVDRFLFKQAILRLFLQVIQTMPGTVQQCVDLLNKGELVAIAPGGLYEALFGDEHYKMLWNKRVGFAKVAIDAKVPVIPVFTENLREAYRTFGVFRYLLHSIFKRTKLPIVPVFGGFPVKLRTWVGEPIEYDPAVTPEQLALKTKAAIEQLIDEHQRIPGSITHALLDRFRPAKSEGKLKES